MKVTLFLFILFFHTVLCAQGFLPKTEDIPLMEGLNQIEEVASFDNPGERLVIISAESTVSEQEILSFYQKTLKNLGWKQITSHTFKRDADRFQIDMKAQKNKVQIQFILSQE